jgi:hypothetical protein
MTWVARMAGRSPDEEHRSATFQVAVRERLDDP